MTTGKLRQEFEAGSHSYSQERREMSAFMFVSAQHLSTHLQYTGSLSREWHCPTVGMFAHLNVLKRYPTDKPTATMARQCLVETLFLYSTRCLRQPT